MPIEFENKKPIFDIRKIHQITNQTLLNEGVKLQGDFVEEQRAAGHWITGNMGRSYWVENGDLEVSVGNSADYMDYVRFGHHSYAGDDFIDRVVNRKMDKIADNLINALEKNL